ncbi:hypothetical protein SAY87_004481 [Trapa incisa]|uniref:Uncharacterized protein n=1 Tax=Trapa incisa TaxID=236973 RepID=A0AAN7JNZ1_9MYRT|nr:hypothetical protein SAY87_004481 [Trapa incisa]
MSRGLDDEKDGEELSESENEDSLFDEDMEALRRACMLTGTDVAVASTSGQEASTDSDSEDDLQLVRSIHNRFSIPLGALKSIAELSSPSDGEDDDFETLRAIQRRFSAFDHETLANGRNDLSVNSQEANSPECTIEGDISDTAYLDKIDSQSIFRASEDQSSGLNHSLNSNKNSEPTGLIEWHKSDADEPSVETHKNNSFPKCARFFVDSIRKNRSGQKLLRSKLIQIDARIGEIKKLKERVKVLQDFQVSCRKRTAQALSQKNDPRVQLISTQYRRKKSKGGDKKVTPICCGPAENCQVANYRNALKSFPLELHRNKWTDAEKENLRKGLKQHFQQVVFQVSLDRFSSLEGDANTFEHVLSSIRDIEISPEEIREFLPRVNWDQLAEHVPGRSGAECEARWLNWEDPLINRGTWTIDEDKQLLHIIQEKGIYNWFEIAVSLGANRTPFQCLTRYQRSLNPCIMRREWTPEEDIQLRMAVEIYGECDWQNVASTLEGRTGTQCSNRWQKVLHPERQKVGRWSRDEDKCLTVAAMVFGTKNWKKVSQFLPGRTHVQCRERWVNSLDPNLKMDEWTAEEDAKLEAAISKHGHCWSKIAACLRPRTDNQCRRRWKLLFPQEVPLLQAAKKIQKRTFASNFVDRTSERPLFSANDLFLLAPPEPTLTSEHKQIGPTKQKRKYRKRSKPATNDDTCVQNSGRQKKRKTSDNNEIATVDLVAVTPRADNCIELDQNASGADETARGAIHVQYRRRGKKRKTSGNNEIATADLVSATPGANNCIELDLSASGVNETALVQNSRLSKKQKTDLAAVTPGANNCSALDLDASGVDETAPGGAPPGISDANDCSHDAPVAALS